MKDPLLRDYRYLNQSTTNSNNVQNSMTRSTISTSESGQELWPVGVKLGIVRLGYSAGKLKYTLVDEQDIVLAREYTFEARLEILNHNTGINGSGAVVFAYAYQTSSSSSSSSSSSTNNNNLNNSTNNNNNQMILLQDLIWRRHYGPIPERKRVVHRNHISMDNRLDNLCLLDLGTNDDNSTTHVWYTIANQVHHLNHHNQTLHHHHNHHIHQNQQQVVIHINNNNNNQRSNTRGHHYHHNHHHQQQQHNHDINNNQVIEHNDDDQRHQQQHQQQQQVMPVQSQPVSLQQHLQPPKSSSNDLHLTLYWAAIQQLPPEHLQQQQQQQQQQSNTNLIDSQAEVNSAARCFDSQGNPINDQDSNETLISYFECHYGPCVRIERCPREFSICGRCQETRYCGTTCQQLDWPYHKRYCRYKARRQLLAPYSYRSTTTTAITTNNSNTTTTTTTSPLSSSYSPRHRSLR